MFVDQHNKQCKQFKVKLCINNTKFGKLLTANLGTLLDVSSVVSEKMSFLVTAQGMLGYRVMGTLETPDLPVLSFIVQIHNISLNDFKSAGKTIMMITGLFSLDYVFM